MHRRQPIILGDISLDKFNAGAKVYLSTSIHVTLYLLQETPGKCENRCAGKGNSERERERERCRIPIKVISPSLIFA